MSGLYLQRKYILLLSNRLEKFKTRGTNLFNFRCVYCGDSKKHANKTRGYLFEGSGEYFYYCQNCGESHKFETFLKFFDQGLYSEFEIEKLRDENDPAFARAEEEKPVTLTPDLDYHKIFGDLPNIASLDNDHVAKKFLLDRQIPERFFDKLFFAQEFKTFVNAIIPGKITGMDSPRIVIPSILPNGKTTGFSGRSLMKVERELRYLIVVLEASGFNVFGLDRVNLNRPYIVVEGQFDSMFLDNAIAVGTSHLSTRLKRLNIPYENAILAFDNEPRSPEILKKMATAIKQNFSVVIWPKDLRPKDINAMVLSGISPSQVQTIINENTYSGLAAEMAFHAWKGFE